MGQESQPPLGDDFRIEPPQRAAGQIAGVGVGLVALGLDLLVHPLKIRVVHIDFAADFQNRRRRDRGRPLVQRQRDRLDRAGVDGHVVAHVAPPARRAQHEPAVLVPQADRRAVDFRLQDIGRLLAAEQLADALVERADFAPRCTCCRCSSSARRAGRISAPSARRRRRAAWASRA